MQAKPAQPAVAAADATVSAFSRQILSSSSLFSIMGNCKISGWQ